ncbi:PREDICTED: NADH dehydrogenase [ubiquinone] iron-sulfur protein 6, mitochondrial [Ceratosolen solmsi marchali]|uniref:NADH dehydrogenase [ubiquinone] iron-sulfur protein 6, mitochondrial n=1 Tax=Ceratosolen solmsi marchali TaxID=326594 RepID=A0AAJ6YN32_9HYME|nr:PREDICTED: NADH dehydrogenase [ubiquinone] iron-sulfur protein 6, mitochondrial [Ceratosolen solmsi marchali]
MASKNVVRLLKNSTKFNCKSLHSSFATWTPPNDETHTDQQFHPDDYRNTRFIGKRKEVNKNWAIKLIAEESPKCVKERIVSCDGGDELLGHPKVYINLDQPGNHTCGYCGIRFYKEDH